MKDHQNMVFGLAVRLLGGNSADAEDVSQSVFLKAYEHFENFGINFNTRGWLKTVTTNLCLNHLKRYRSRWRFFSEMRGENDGAYVDELPGADHMNEFFCQADRQHALEQALQLLPESQRVPLVLFHFEEMPYEEIAKQLDVTTGKIKTDIHRGRLALRKIIEMPPAKRLDTSNSKVNL